MSTAFVESNKSLIKKVWVIRDEFQGCFVLAVVDFWQSFWVVWHTYIYRGVNRSFPSEFITEGLVDFNHAK